MNISSSTASYASQTSSTQARPQGPPPKKAGKEQLSAALETVGVDNLTAASVLSQVDEAISALGAGSSSHSKIRSVIQGVLEENGIDPGEVEEAIQAVGGLVADEASSSRGPSGSGRPGGTPPPRQKNEIESGSIESALLSAGVDESSTDELIGQIIGTIQDLASESSGSVSQSELRTAFTSLLGQNGVNISAFDQAIGDQLASEGLFLDVLA